MANERFRQSRNYAGLPDVEGIRFVSYATAEHVVCPFCSSNEAALLAGNISLTAQMSNEDVSDRVTLAGFICPSSHVFFLREGDVLAVPNAFEGASS